MTATEISLEMRGVGKKFRKGELHDSLRDLIPALANRLLHPGRARPADAREFWALRDVNFEVRRGEAFGIIGHNGAGKSTILKILSGIMRPTVGTMQVVGRLSALIEVGAGFHPDLTGRENVYLNGAILGMTRAEIRRKFDEIVAFADLAEFIDTPVKRYSSGMFARLGFAVAAHVDPDVLIVDEVLSVGDYVFQQRCMERMATVLHSGTTVIFVSHNLRAVAELCQRALLMEHGQVTATGTSEEVVRSYLRRAEARRPTDHSSTVFVSQVDVRDAEGSRAHFRSGDVASVDVEVVARAPYEKLAVIVGVRDDKEYDVFHISSESLTRTTIALAKDEAVTCTFDLRLHLAPGRYRLVTWIYRFDTQTLYDHWQSAATFFVSHESDVRGAANLYPEVRISPVHAPRAVQGRSSIPSD